MMDIHLDKMCRICLKEGDNLKSIFYNDEVPKNHVSVSNKIMACSSVRVIAGDGLPELICHECLTQVDVAYDFREKCQSADTTLRKYISIVEPIYNCKKNNQVPVKLEEPQTFTNGVHPLDFVKAELTALAKEAQPSQDLMESDGDVSHGTTQKKKDDKPVETKNKKPKASKKYDKKTKASKKCDEEGDKSDNDKKKQTKDEKDVKCPVCKKIFAYLCILKGHMVQHTGAKPYLCSACGKSFAHKASLTNHMKTHYSDKPHKCDRCELSFHRRAHLVLHMRTHTGEKPFVCDVCGRDFAQNSYLKEHMRVHSGEKPFVCDICGHGFARKSCLIMHRRVHTGELPFACPECGRAFSQRSQRKRHVKKNHKGSACLRATGELILKDLDLKNKKLIQEESTNENSLNENSLTENSLSLPQDRMMQQQQPQHQYQPSDSQGNNPPLIIYHQDNMSTLYPTTVLPLPHTNADCFLAVRSNTCTYL